VNATPTVATPRHDPYAALRLPAFRWFVISLLTMTVAAQIQVIVVSWQIYAITHDPLSLGLIGLSEALPFIGVALFAGHIADRSNRQRISVTALFVLVLCAGALLAFSFAMQRVLALGVWPFYTVIAVSGLARSFLQPARNALAAELVPRELYHNAIAWRSSTWQTAAVIGPAVGGLLYGFGGPRIAYVVQAILMSVAFLTFARIEYAGRAQAVSPAGPITESLTVGLRFVWSQPLLLGALTLDLFSVLLGGAEALLPVFADRILHVGPQGLGILRAAPAAGAVLMSLHLAHRQPFKRAGRTLLLAVATFAICIVGFGLSRSLYLSILLLLASGMADNVSVLVRSTLLQVLTPADLLGRVSSVNSIFIGSSNEIGAFESGVAARILGAVPAVVFGGLASLLVVGVVALTIPSLRRMRVIDQPAG
jgi:MFS family permease